MPLSPEQKKEQRLRVRAMSELRRRHAKEFKVILEGLRQEDQRIRANS